MAAEMKDNTPHGVSDLGEPDPLLNFAAKKIEVKETAHDDVRSAMREVAAGEHKHRIASELGNDGVSKMAMWDERISQVGANAAAEAASLYASSPRLPAKEEEPEGPDQHINAARSAYRSAQAKAEANIPQALLGLDRMEQRHGNLGVVDKFRRWDSQLRENPADAAPRIATEIGQHVNNDLEMDLARRAVADFRAKNKISAEEQAVMQRVLASGQVADLPTAHAYAKHELSMDGDSYDRDVASAVRQLRGPDAFLKSKTAKR
jgi:hypothetical protein